MDPIKNVLARNRRKVEVFVTLGIIALLIFYYYALYVPQKERSIVEHRFRMMQQIDDNMRAKLRGLESLMRNYMVISSDTNLDYNAIEKFIKEKSSPHFSLSVNRTSKNPGEFPVKSTVSVSKLNHGGSFVLTMDTIAYSKDFPGADTCKLILNAEISMTGFLEPILRKDQFDEYIILNDSIVVYQTFPSGLSYYTRDSLLQTKNGVATGRDRDLVITGTNYRLFMQPIKFRNYEDWIVIGLMDVKSLNAEKRYLPGSVIEWLVIAVLLFCFLLPWIKILLMGKSERIKLEDVAIAYICGLLLISFIFFISFKYNVPLRPTFTDKGTLSSDSKIIIANSIAADFQNEIETVYQQLRTFDSLRASNAELKQIKSLKNIEKQPLAGINFGNDNSWFTPERLNDSIIKNSVHYPHFINTFWLDSAGRELSNWSRRNENPPPPGIFSGRSYFKNVQQQKMFAIAGSPEKKYFLEPLYSWSDREFKVALSIPSQDSGSVAVITFRPQSIIEPVMIPGFLFAIIDKEGEVLFHSDPDKNLNENLISEVSAAKTIRTSLQTHIATGFITEYGGKRYAGYITPLLTLPYAVTVFSDWQYKERRNIECFSFSLMMFFTFFFILCLELVMIIIGSFQKTRLRKNKFNLNWIFPLESKRNAYAIMFFVYAGTAVLLSTYIFFTKSSSLIQFLFIFLSSAVLLSLISSFVFGKLELLNDNKINRHFKSVHIKVWMLAFAKTISRLLRNSASAWLLFLWLIINCSAFYYLRIEYIVTLLFQAVIMIIAVLAIMRREDLNKISFRLSYAHLFSSMIFMRLLITGGLPMVVFYVSGYNYDQHVTTRHRLLEFAREIKVKSMNADCLPLADNNRTHNCFSAYNDRSWVKGFEVVDTLFRNDRRYTRQEISNLSIIHSARIGYNQLSQVGDDLSNLQSTDKSWRFNSVFADADTCYLRLNDALPATSNQAYLRVYSDNKLSYQFPSIFNWDDPKQVPRQVMFWMILFFVLVLFYMMLHFMVQRLYGILAANPKGLNDMYRPIIRDNKLNNLLFINGAPGSGKVELAKRELAKAGLVFDKENQNAGAVVIIDMIDIPDSTEVAAQLEKWEKQVSNVLDSNCSYVIFNHFEYNINDQNSNRIKLNMLERFMREGKKKLIIVSTIHQSAFLDSLNEYTPKNDAEKKALTEDLPRWDVLLGHFVNLYVSLNQEIEEICTHRPKDWTFALTIWEECRHTNFLRKLHCPMQSFVAQRLEKDEASLDQEDIILKVQSLAHLFYLYMWNSLLREEQFLLYDLAEDGLINTKNKTLIRRLMNKGLIHLKDGRLILFNKSFRNFILTSISATDVKIIEQQINDNGTWKSLRYPALLILAALSYFIFTAEQENMGEVMKYVSALAAGIPLIIKMLSFVLPADSK